MAGDQCPFGQESVDSEGFGLVQKATLWSTDLPEVADAVAVRCCNRSLPPAMHHRHVHLLSGRAKAAKRYPPLLVRAILKALAKARKRLLHLDALETHPTLDEPDFTSLNEEYWQQDPVATVKDDDEEELIVYDHYTGFRLPSDGVKAARKDEMDFLDSLKVWTLVPIQMCRDETNAAPVGVRWIDCNKGDSEHLELRSRLVVQETKRVSSIAKDDVASTFSATPPLESLRILLSVTMTFSSHSSDPNLRAIVHY